MRDGTQDGMQCFDGELDKLIRSGAVELETGISYASNQGNLRLELADFIEDQLTAKAAAEAQAEGSEATPELESAQ
jgi:Tfp pilus assembly ATPase PilU